MPEPFGFRTRCSRWGDPEGMDTSQCGRLRTGKPFPTSGKAIPISNRQVCEQAPPQPNHLGQTHPQDGFAISILSRRSANKLLSKATAASTSIRLCFSTLAARLGHHDRDE